MGRLSVTKLGYSQRPGLDYEDTFSPVVRFKSVRTVIAVAAQNGLKLHQMDVTTAFLNGELEEVYLRQPEGFVAKGCERLICRLKRGLYGHSHLDAGTLSLTVISERWDSLRQPVILVCT